MLLVRAGTQLGLVELDVCDVCFSIWFDTHELDQTPKATDREIKKRIAEGSIKFSPEFGNEHFGSIDYIDIASLVLGVWFD